MEKLTSCYPTGLESQITPKPGKWVPEAAYIVIAKIVQTEHLQFM